MAKRFIDLSVPMDPASKEPSPPQIAYMNHEQSVERAAGLFGIRPEDWPEQKAWATETVTLTTHTGTHVDAPWHYWFKTGDEPAKTIDQLPLEWFYGNGVLLDFTWKQPRRKKLRNPMWKKRWPKSTTGFHPARSCSFIRAVIKNCTPPATPTSIRA